MKKLLFLFLILFCSSVFGLVRIDEYSDLNSLGGGLQKFTHYSEPMYYFNDSNILVDINAQYEKITGGFFDWKVTKGLYVLKVKEDGTLRIIHQGDKITLKLLGYGLYNKETKQYIIDTNLSLNNPTVSKNRITWSLPLDSNYSIYYQNGSLRDVVVISQQVKTYLKNNRPSSWILNNTFVGLIYYVDINKTSNIDVNGQDVNGDFESEGSINFTQDGNKVHSIIPAHVYNSDLNHFDSNHEMTMWWKKKIYNKSKNIYIEVAPIKSLWSAEGTLTFNATITFFVKNGRSEDDCDESASGTVDTTSATASFTITGMWGGIRFQNIDINKDSVISNAILSYSGGVNCDTECTGDWFGVDQDNPSWWSSVNKPSGATKTTASTTWDASGTLQPNSDYQSWDKNVTDIVQEIINRADWDAGDSLAFILDIDTILKGNGYSFRTYDGIEPKPKLEVVFEATEDYSFALILPSTGCTEGKGSIDAGETCDRAWFDYNGTTNCGSTENKLFPEGQTITLPFWVIDNQSTTPNDFKVYVDLNANMPSGVTLKATNRYDLAEYWDTYSNCYYGTLYNTIIWDCVILDDSNKFFDTVYYSSGTQDFNVWLWGDFSSGCTTGQHERTAIITTTGVG